MELTSDPRYDALRRNYQPVLSTAQVAEILQLDIRTVMKAVQLGNLKASRMPGARKWRFLLEDVIAMIEQNFTTVGADDTDTDDKTDVEDTSAAAVAPAAVPAARNRGRAASDPAQPTGRAQRGRGSGARTT